VRDPKLEDVFKINGVPTYTFVEPKEYNHLLMSLRAAGRRVVVEGPSGIGKTTAGRKSRIAGPAREYVLLGEATRNC
jgi:hypothetical protein